MRHTLVVLCSLAVACTGPAGTGGSGGGNGAGGSSGAGGGSSGTGGGSASSSYPCDVGGIVSSSCLECHANPPLFGAPMPLVTYADTQADSALFPGQKIHQRMAARVSATDRPMPQAPRTLTAAQISAITAWSSAGAPPGSGSCGTGGGAGGGGGSGGGAGGRR